MLVKVLFAVIVLGLSTISNAELRHVIPTGTIVRNHYVYTRAPIPQAKPVEILKEQWLEEKKTFEFKRADDSGAWYHFDNKAQFEQQPSVMSYYDEDEGERSLIARKARMHVTAAYFEEDTKSVYEVGFDPKSKNNAIHIYYGLYNKKKPTSLWHPFEGELKSFLRTGNEFVLVTEVEKDGKKVEKRLELVIMKNDKGKPELQTKKK